LVYNRDSSLTAWRFGGANVGSNFISLRARNVTDDVKKMSIVLGKRLPGDFPSLPEPGDGLVTVSCEREMPDTLVAGANAGKPVTTSTEAVNGAYLDMKEYVVRILRLIRWRANSHGRPNQLRMFLDLSWSFDGIQWKPVQRIAVGATLVLIPGPTRWTTDAEEFVRKELTGDLDEPLGHELLREAWANLGQNPRSSLVLAVAAAEVGFKQFASKSLPETAWVLENLPSPPLIKMLKEFPWAKIGQIHNRVPIVPKVILKKLEEAVTLRNKLSTLELGI
jgi:hypothetical protein